MYKEIIEAAREQFNSGTNGGFGVKIKIETFVSYKSDSDHGFNPCFCIISFRYTHIKEKISWSNCRSNSECRMEDPAVERSGEVNILLRIERDKTN